MPTESLLRSCLPPLGALLEDSQFGEVRAMVDEDRFDGVTCPACGAGMNVHQPDEARPDRLLAACGGCGAWFVTTADLDALTPLPLPEGDALRRPPR